MEVKLNDKDLDMLAERVSDIVLQKMTTGAAYNAAFAALEERGKQAAEMFLASKPDMFAAAELFRTELAARAHTTLPQIITTAVNEVLGSKDGLRRAVIAQVIKDAQTGAAEHVIRQLRTLQHFEEDEDEQL